MREKGIEPPPRSLFETDSSGKVVGFSKELSFWLQQLFAKFPKIETFSKTFDPVSVPVGEAYQDFDVKGLTTADLVVVNRQADTTGFWIKSAYVPTANKLRLVFRNETASAVDLASETYLIVAVRM